PSLARAWRQTLGQSVMESKPAWAAASTSSRNGVRGRQPAMNVSRSAMEGSGGTRFLSGWVHDGASARIRAPLAQAAYHQCGIRRGVAGRADTSVHQKVL